MHFTHTTPKRIVILIALALVAAGAAPLLAGPEVTAENGKQARQPAGETRLGATAVQRFENTDVRLGIIDGGIATSSAIEVSGLPGQVTDVDINLISISHGPTSTQDIDVLLIGPEGKSALILSDVGGNTATQNVTLVLDDQQLDQLPSSAALSNGFFQPTNIGSPDTMNLGNGPITPPSGASLGRFNGINPNGTWRLFVFDDTPNGSPQAGSGINGGWAVTITTTDDGIEAKPDCFQAQAGKTLRVDAPGVLKNDTDPNGEPLKASLDKAAKKGKVTLQANGSFTYKPKPGAQGRDSFTYQARNGNGLTAKAKVTIRIKAAKPKNGQAGQSSQR